MHLSVRSNSQTCNAAASVCPPGNDSSPPLLRELGLLKRTVCWLACQATVQLAKLECETARMGCGINGCPRSLSAQHMEHNGS